MLTCRRILSILHALYMQQQRRVRRHILKTGIYVDLLLQMDDSSFQKHMRLSRRQFEFLLNAMETSCSVCPYYCAQLLMGRLICLHLRNNHVALVTLFALAYFVMLSFFA